MSHPKSGSVIIRDLQRLATSQRKREEDDAKELARLEKRARRDARAEARIVELRKKDERRRQRDAKLAAELQRRAEQERRLEEEIYQRTLVNFGQALSRRTDLLQRFDGLELPPEPEIADPAGNDAANIRLATAALQRVARDYQNSVDRALIAFHRRHEASASGEKAGALAARLESRAIRTCADVISALEPVTHAARAGAVETRLERRTSLARELVAKWGAGKAWSDRFELSVQSIDALNAVVAATSDTGSNTAMRRLEKSLTEDNERAKKAHIASDERERQARLLEESESKQRQHEMVLAAIRSTLQDLGHTVSEVEKSATVRNGAMYFSKSGWNDHAVRLEIDDNLKVHMEALRVADSGQLSGKADAARQDTEDKQFDQQWCSKTGGLGTLLQTLNERDVPMALQVDPETAGSPMRRVTDKVARGVVAKASGIASSTTPLKTRQLPGNR